MSADRFDPPRPRDLPPNRRRVDDYYGVHDTGMGEQGPSRPASPTGPHPPRPRPFPQPPEPEARETTSSRPDPLTDPLTSQTFEKNRTEADGFEPSNFGYSTTAYSSAPDPEVFGSRDPFAPPKFERSTFDPPSFDPGTSERAAEASAPVEEHVETYIDVEIVDVAVASRPIREPLALDAFPYTPIDESYVERDTLPEEPAMTDLNQSLGEAMAIDGALGAALVDAQSGMALATAGDPTGFNLEIAAAGNAALVQAMSRSLGDMDLDDHIEDILITLGTQYQIVRPIRRSSDGLFLYLVLDRARANLAMARFRLTKLEESIEV